MLSNYGSISKIQRKNHYLQIQNSEIGRKNHYLQVPNLKLEGKTPASKFKIQIHKVVQFSFWSSH